MKYVTDLSDVPAGTPISCYIGGIRIYEGRIQKEGGEVFICQDKKPGNSCSNKLGFNFSWSVGCGKHSSIESNSVSKIILEALTPPTEEEEKETHNKSVLKYVKENLNSTLYFKGWTFDPLYRKIDDGFKFMNLCEIDKLVITILSLAEEFESASSNNKLETTRGRSRSALDVWRHAKQFFPIDIFSIMRSLFKISYYGAVYGVGYCSTVKRMVFSRGSAPSIRMAETPDEFGGYLKFWENIKE